MLGRCLPLGDEHEQIEFCERIQTEGLSVRAIEQMVQEQIRAVEPAPAADGKPSRPSRGRNHNLISARTRASRIAGRESVDPSNRPKVAGKLSSNSRHAKSSSGFAES